MALLSRSPEPFDVAQGLSGTYVDRREVDEPYRRIMFKDAPTEPDAPAGWDAAIGAHAGDRGVPV